MTRKRGPRSDALANDERILRAAARVLADDPRATMQRIADEAGVVRLTVYRRYADREALRRAIFKAGATEAEEVIARTAAAGLGPVESLRRLIVELADIGRRYPLLYAESGSARVGRPPASRSLREAVTALVEEGQAKGVLRRDLPAGLLPRGIVGTLRAMHEFGPPDPANPDRTGELVAELVLRGFGVASAADSRT